MEEIKLNLENLSEEEHKQLMKLIEKANAPKSKVWTPKYGEEYFYILLAGETYKGVWRCSLAEENTYEQGNIFESREQAEEESKRRKILTQWKRLSIEAGEDENPWDEDHEHWYCYYNFSTRKFREDFKYAIKCEGIYFPSEDSLHDAIETIGEENVKKYILGVKDE